MNYQISTADSGRGIVVTLNTPNGNVSTLEHDDERLPEIYFPNKGRLQMAMRNTAAAVVKLAREYNPQIAEAKIAELSGNPGLRQAAEAFHNDLRKVKEKLEDDIGVANAIRPVNPSIAPVELATTSAYAALNSHAARVKFVASLGDSEVIPLARLPLVVLALSAEERERLIMRKIRRLNFVSALKSPESNVNFTPTVTLNNLAPIGLDPEKVEFWVSQQQKDFDYRAGLIRTAENYLRNVVSFYALLFSKNAAEAENYFLPKPKAD